MSRLSLRVCFAPCTVLLAVSCAMACLVAGCTKADGFAINGAYPEVTDRSNPWWGSWNERAGDSNTGQFQTSEFRLQSVLHLPVAGYPALEGNRVFLRDSNNATELPLTLINPGERWEEASIPIPSDWVGRAVRLIAVDQRTGYQGWFALEPPLSGFETFMRGSALFFASALAFLLLGIGFLRSARAIEVRQWLVEHQEQCLLAITCVFLAVHFVVLVGHAVNVPVNDEWAVVIGDAIGRWPNWRWTFAFHNEHRIVPTRLLAWLLYRLCHWNLVAQIVINFALYVTMLLVGYRLARRHLDLRLGAVALLAAATIASENHMWAFQSSFHLFLLLFLGSIACALRGGGWTWIGCLAAIGSAYSLGSGVICATVCALFYAYLGLFRHPAARVSFLLQSAIIMVALGCWFVGYHSPENHPPLALPTGTTFWKHFLNLLSGGFGYSAPTVFPGIALAILIVALVLNRLRTIRFDPRADGWAGLLAVVIGISLSLSAISVARAGFGAGQAKASRYAEISFLLLPCVWLLICQATERVSKTARALLLAVSLVGLYSPFYNDFSYVETYGGAMYLQRIEARKCVQRYLLGLGEPRCPTSFPDTLQYFLASAVRLRLSFVEDMVEKQ